jgi:ethanolamine utilization protein EutN
MYLARVIGNVVATIKHPFFEGRKLLLVQRLDLAHQPTAAYDIAVDDVLAGVGDLVLVMDEGTGARQVLRGGTEAPVRAVVVGVVDDVQLTVPTPAQLW